MNKNYYDILQVNRNASAEIVEKAYKTLAKKYHPDLQTEENKKQSEEILKEINEAYEILSDPEKKQNYDQYLVANDFYAFQKSQPKSNSSPNYSQTSKDEMLYKQQEELLRQQKLQQEMQYQEQLRREQEIAYQQQLQQAKEKAYYDAYIQDLKNRGYKIRYKKSFKDYLKGFSTLVIVILVLFLLWQIPFVQNYFFNLYEENEIIHLAIDFVLNLFK